MSSIASFLFYYNLYICTYFVLFISRRDRSSYSSGHASDSSIGDSPGPRGRSRSLKRMKSSKPLMLLLKPFFLAKLLSSSILTVVSHSHFLTISDLWASTVLQNFVNHFCCKIYYNIFPCISNGIQSKQKLTLALSSLLVSSRSDAASSSGYESMRNDTSHASSDSCSEKGLSRGKRKGKNWCKYCNT